MQLAYKQMDNWPTLAWIARLTPGDNCVEIWHGTRVEVRDAWFCEAVWAGEFSQGDFDLTDRFFGSGARLRDDALTFVSSATTCDRLHHATVDGVTWVSNSLPCLMQHIGARIDPTFDRYYHFFGSMTCGIKRYARDLKTSRGPVRVTYYANQRWDGKQLNEIQKQETTPHFDSFETYRAFLEDCLKQMSLNMSSPHRAYPFKMLGTISSGYDSATIATLASQFGLRDVIAFSPSRNGWPDSGDEVAAKLGLELKVIDRRTWCSSGTSPEHLFIAADAKGQDIFFHGARPMLEGRALLTGFSGDMLWDRDIQKFLSEFVGSKDPVPLTGEMIRGDRSGLSMTEYRLHVGFIHCPIPYLGARRIADIVAISNSEVMKPWDIGGKYTRPIPRRIVEGIGVPRESFGQYKRGSSVLWFEKTGLHDGNAVKDYEKWLATKSRDFRRAGKLPPLLVKRTLAPLQWVAKFGWSINNRTKSLPKPFKWISKIGRKLGEFSRREYATEYMFGWALERTQQLYRVDSAQPVSLRSNSSSEHRALSASAA